MRFRNWLLTGTSITLLALAPTTAARAQDVTNPALVAAFQAFQADQSDDNKQKLSDACTAAGFAGLDDCLAALQAPPPAPSVEAPPPPPPSEEAPPPAPPSEEAPPPAPSSEEAPPPPPPSEEAPPPAPSSEEAPPPAPSSEQAPPPAPSSEEPPPPAPSSEAPPPAPSSEEPPPPPSVEAPPAPSSEEAPPPAPSSKEAPPPDASSEVAPPPDPSSEEPPPAVSSEVTPPAVSSELAPPAVSSEVAPPPSEPGPSSAEPPAPDPLAQLTAAVAAYNQGVADLTAGSANGQPEIDAAKAQIDQLCASGGFADSGACLAQFGLTLNPLPAKPGEPSSETPAVPSSEQPVAPSEPPKPSEPPPISELPNASEQVTPSAVEPLPPDTTTPPAPILDSVKDLDNPDNTAPPPPVSPTEPPAPPPPDDKTAQEDIKPPPVEDQSTQTDKGKPTDIQIVQPQTPPDNKDIKIIVPPPADPNAFVFQIGINIYINNPQQDRDRFYDQNDGDKIVYEELSRGRTRETVIRRNGVRVVTIRDKYGDVLQRSKILPDGREIVLASYDPRDRDINDWRDPGEDLPPLRLTIPARDYILDADTADEDDVYNFLDQPPVEKVKRIYTIDEVKRSSRLRDSVRRLEVGGLTFDSGKATISRNQVGALQGTAQAMLKMLGRNPGEVFLIEGHTDAVGSDVANLVLSDQRAATVARILTDFYDIPPENLVTQGYGERYLKVKTDQAEPINRRVVVKRITSLVAYDNAKG